MKPRHARALPHLLCAALLSVSLGVNGAESPYLYGIHDHSPDPSEFLNHVKNATGAGGWVTATFALGSNTNDFSGANLTSLSSAGHTIIGRLNNGYFPDGAIPVPAKYDDFAVRCKNFVANSSGCNIWLIGNESNLNVEWPYDSSNGRFNYLSPQDYATCFRKVYNAIKSIRPNDKVIPQALAPWGGPYGSTSDLNGSGHPADGMPLTWVQYMNQMLTAIQASGPLDGIALHIGSRGYAYADIHSTTQVNAGGQNLYWSFYNYKDWINYGIPSSLYSLPLYATECTGLYYWKGGGPPGEDLTKHYEAGWMQEIFAELNRYNQSAATNGKPIFRCVNFYRWCAYCDGWNIDADGSHPNPYKAQILADLDAAAAQKYAWPTNVTVTNPPAAPTGLTAAVGNGNVTLNWNAAAFASSYNVKRSTTNGGPYAVIASNLPAPGYVNTSITPNTTYHYRASALNSFGESTNSAQASATPTNALPDVIVTAITWIPTGPLYAPTNVVFSATVKNQGAGATPGGTVLGVGFQVDGNQVSWSGTYSSSLAPGASITLTADSGPASVNYWTATPGAHTVTANVDDINRFPEGDESNNTLAQSFTVLASGYAVNAGGPAAGAYGADNYWSGSANTYSNNTTIDLSGVTNPAPMAVYQTERWGNSTYALSNLTAGASYSVRLHWAEISPSVSTNGDRRFQVTINGSQVLTNFDIFAAAGGKFKAVARQFTATANGAGQIVVQFTQGAANEAKINGLEVSPAAPLAPVLAPIANRTINEGDTLSFVALGSDPQPGTGFADFESLASGTTSVLFRAPTISSTTSGFLDPSPNIAMVTNSSPIGNASTRTLFVSWSFKTGTSNPWLRLTASAAGTTPNPIVDFGQSVRFDVWTDRDLKVGLGLRETNPTNAIGADGGTTGPIEFAGVPSTIGTFPIPLRTVPASNWITLTFNLTNEQFAAFTGNSVLDSTTGKGVLEHLALVPAAGLGTYNVYLDNFTVVPPSSLAYALSNAPAGATIAATNGIFAWTPSESQGPGAYNITTRLTKDGLSASAQTFTVTVNESNLPPGLAGISNQLVNAGSTLLLTNTATDPDLPANTFTFSLDSGPAGANVNSNSGVFSWTAPATLTRITNSANVRVTDSGSPSLTASNSFSIIVVPPPQVSGIAAVAGSAVLNWQTFPNKTYRVEYKNDLGETNWTVLGGDLVATGNTLAFTNSPTPSPCRFYRIRQVN